MTGRLLLHALPLALALFLLFPRLPGPFWALPAPGGGGRTGLSDQMSPGDITVARAVGRGGLSRPLQRARARCPRNSTGGDPSSSASTDAAGARSRTRCATGCLRCATTRQHAGCGTTRLQL